MKKHLLCDGQGPEGEVRRTPQYILLSRAPAMGWKAVQLQEGGLGGQLAGIDSQGTIHPGLDFQRLQTPLCFTWQSIYDIMTLCFLDICDEVPMLWEQQCNRDQMLSEWGHCADVNTTMPPDVLQATSRPGKVGKKLWSLFLATCSSWCCRKHGIGCSQGWQLVPVRWLVETVARTLDFIKLISGLAGTFLSLE